MSQTTTPETASNVPPKRSSPRPRPTRRLKPLWLPALLLLGVSLACAGAAPAGDSVSESARKQRCSARYSAFSVGQWPAACWRPYSSRSPFNRRIPAHPALYPGSSDIVRRLLSFGRPNALRAGIADTDSDYYHPTYYARRSDPLYTISGGSSTPPYAVDGKKVRLPARARPAAGSDHHLTIVYNRHDYGLWDAHISGATISVGSGRRISIGGSGLNAAGTAGRFGGLAGIIRAQEMAAGRINHALFMAVQCTNGEGVYPADGGPKPCDNPSNAPPMGAHFQLAMSDSKIRSLHVPAWKKTILRAMARYGMFVGDVTGSPWAFQFESGSTYTSFGHRDKMVEFAKRARVPFEDGNYVFDVNSGVDWGRYLRVLAPHM